MSINTSDAELVSGHLAGDRGALAGIYDRYADTLYDTAAAMLNDRTEAADVLQDTILIAAERLGQLRDPTRLKPWLFAILRNEVYRRTKQRRRTVATDFSGTDETHGGWDMADERQPEVADTVADALAGDEMASMLRGAAAGLDERDQLVLELSVRQGLDGQDLADALGVSANQSYTLVHRMRERVERSLGAYAIARAGRKDCDDLDSMLARWDGEFTVLIRKRVARHIDRCATCSDNRKKVAPLALFAGAPALAAPPDLRERILQKAGDIIPKHEYGFTADGGFPEVLAGSRKVAGWIAPSAAASVVLLAAVAGFVWLGGDGDSSVQTATPIPTAEVTTTEPATTAEASTTDAPTTTDAPAVTAAATPSSTESTTTTSSTTTTTAPPTTPAPTTTAPPVVAPPPPPPSTSPPSAPPPPPPPTTTTTTVPPLPGRLQLSSSVVDLGSSAPSGSTTLTNVGGMPVSYAITGDPGVFGVTPLAGTLGPGQSVPIVVSVDRSSAPEGIVSAAMQATGDGASQPIRLRADIARPPVIGSVTGPSSGCATFGASQVLGISATIAPTDESPPLSATFSVSGPLGQSGNVAMTGQSTFTGNHQFVFTSQSEVVGPWPWTITVTDALGNVATTNGTHTVTC